MHRVSAEKTHYAQNLPLTGSVDLRLHDRDYAYLAKLVPRPTSLVEPREQQDVLVLSWNTYPSD